MRNRIWISAVCLLMFIAAAEAQTTSFTYQGKLTDSGNLANAVYDMQFKLFDASANGNQVGATLTFDGVASNPPAVTVANGVFTVTLDFGTCPPPFPCFDGNQRFLEIAVKPHGSGSYTPLTPRQPITPTPYAIKTQYLTTNGPYNDGTSIFNAANAFVGEGAGVNTVPNAVLNNSIGKWNSFFGAGAGQANVGGFANSFFGFLSGLHTTGSGNSFFGSQAGISNDGGLLNTFIGQQAGFNNVFGNTNTFVGVGADFNSTNQTGTGNTLLGIGTKVNSSVNNATAIGGRALVTQSNSLILGSINGVNNANADTNVGIGTTAPGERLHVVGNGLFTGNLTVNGTLNANLPSGNGNYIQNTTSPQPANFNVTGDGTAAGTLNGNVVNANTQFNIAATRAFIMYDPTGLGTTDTFAGSLAGIQNQSGRFNSFFGCGAGQSNTVGTGNSYFGCGAGGNNQSGGENTYVGRSSGFSDVGGSRNSFFGSFSGNGLGSTASDVSLFGYRAGNANTASGNTFIGSFAGEVNSSGNENTFIGFESGKANTTTFKNTFAGYQAGRANTAINNTFLGAEAGLVNTFGSANTFIGTLAGRANTSGAGNTFLGYLAGLGLSVGQGNVTGGDNTLIGVQANVGTGSLTNASAIGAEAFVTQSNSLVLGGISGVNGGTDVNVGIGTTAPATRLHVSGAGIVRARVNSDSNAGLALTLSDQPKWSVATTTGGNFQIFNDAIGQNAVFIDTATNFVGINFLAPGGTVLCRNGSAQISNCSSSIRYKTNLAALETGFSLINKLRPVTFDWKQDGAHDLGLVAEDVAKVEPLLVTHNDKGQIEGVKYDRIAVVLINAVKEQQKFIEHQQQEIDALKKLVCSSRRKAKACQ